jgi:hypothetical protein
MAIIRKDSQDESENLTIEINNGDLKTEGNYNPHTGQYGTR